MPALDREGDVFVLELGDEENRFEPLWLGELRELVEEVAIAAPPRALVTVGGGRFFSTGLDLDWIRDHDDGVAELLADLHELLARMLELPVPTVAAVQGHAFAGGALFALAHDARVMRADRGYFCPPEIDGRIPFTPGLAGMIRARIAPQVAHEAMTTGRRYGGEEAVTAGIVDEAAAAESVRARAVARAAALADKDPATLGAIKGLLYRAEIDGLRDREANAGDASFFASALTTLGR